MADLEVVVHLEGAGHDGQVLLGALLEKVAVVRHEQQSALVLVAGSYERVD